MHLLRSYKTNRQTFSIVQKSLSAVIEIWDKDTGSQIKTLTGHSDAFNALVVLPNGYLASGSYDSEIKIWNTTPGDEIKTLTGHNDWVNSLAVMPNGYLASGRGDYTIKIWNTGAEIRTITWTYSCSKCISSITKRLSVGLKVDFQKLTKSRFSLS